MAFADNDIFRITLRYRVLGQVCMNVYDYKIHDVLDPPVDALNAAEDFWEQKKTLLRALAPNAATFRFVDINVKNMTNPEGDYGTWAIPSGEVAGTRSVSTDAMPPFNAVGIQMTVGTRVTRPGQKRIAGMHEGDQAEGVLTSSITTPAIALAEEFATDLHTRDVLEIDYATPVIVHLDESTELPTASQPVTGYLLNTNVDSQVSRKIGRGQ